MTRWKQFPAGPAWRGRWLAGVLAAVAALAVVAGGLAAARPVAGWWAGPRSIGVGTEGADAVAVSPDGETLYAANWDGEGASGGITVVSLATGQPGRRVSAGGPVVGLAMMPGGRALCALVEEGSGGDRLVRVGLATLRAAELGAFPYGVQGMVPAGTMLYVLAGTPGGSMAVVPVDVGSGRREKAIPVPPGSQAIAVSPGGRMLYVGAGGAGGKGPGEVIPVDARTGKAGRPAWFTRPVTGLAISPDGRRLFGLSSSYQCRDGGRCGGRCDLVGLDLMTGAARSPARLDSGCDQVEVTPDQRAVLVLNSDNSLTAVDATTGQVEATTRTAGFIAGEGDSGFLIAPDGRTAYIADQSRGIVVIPVNY